MENKGTIVLQARLDIRRVAEVGLYLREKEGHTLAHKSDIVTIAVHTVADSLVAENKIDRIDSYDSAVKVMQQLGLDIFTEDRQRGVKKRLAMHMSREDIESDIEDAEVKEEMLAAVQRAKDDSLAQVDKYKGGNNG